MYTFKKKNKIYRKYEDFFTSDDLKDPDTQQRINLTIEDFDAEGQVANPRAPCVVATIDPEYIKDAAFQSRTRKFRMKTDILRLREITRKKFMIFATQQRYLEKQREAAYQEEIYKRITAFQEFATEALCKMESNAFNEMKETQKHLEKLQETKINEELKVVMAEHQRVLMEVQEIYGRFLFLLKLIGYFDEIIAPEDIIDDKRESSGCKLPQPNEIVNLQINERYPIGEKEVSSIVEYMDKVVRPYLAKRNHLNADIWLKGYERTRLKIFNYNRRFTHVALLNHLVSIVHDKSEKTFARRSEKPIFLKDVQFFKHRIEFLKFSSLQLLDNFERKQKKDKQQLILTAMVPVILSNIETKFTKKKCDELKMSSTVDRQRKNKYFTKSAKPKTTSSSTSHEFGGSDNGVLQKVEKMQWHLMSLLQELDKISPDDVKQIERQVRKRIEMKKEMSHRTFVKQNRLQNWMNHFKRHEILRQQE